MAYIGREPQIGNYQICDAISVVNGQAAYTMQVSSTNVIPESVNHMIVSLNGVIQKPGSSYTISSSTITFSSNLATGDSIDFIYLLGNTLDLGTPSDSTITTAKLSGNLVTPGTLDVNGQELILDADADTSITADTDDQIDIKVAGADDFRITANTFTALSGSGVVIPDSGLTLGSTAVTSTAAELNLLDGVSGLVQADLTKLAAVDATAAELNLLDGGTSVGGSITLADADGVVVNDGGTMKTIPASDIKTYAGVSGDVTTIDSIFKADLKIGEDDQTKIDFETANKIHLYTNNTKRIEVDAQGKIIQDVDADNNTCYHMKNINATNPYGIALEFTAVANDNNSTYFFHGQDSDAVRIRIWSDGDIVNHDNSYGSISDERIKSNIADANSQWNDIKAVKVRNYKKNDDIAAYGDNAATELGVIAQELEASNMNGLVKNEVLYVSTDKEVIDGDKNVGDVKTYKSVKYSILYMKAIKALQEAMAKIETLETKVQALEDA